MQIEIKYKPAHTLAVASLGANESIRAEAGAMVSMSSNVDVATKANTGKKKGGIFGALKRALLAGESFFMNDFTAQGGEGEVTLAPQLCGDMVVHDLTGGTLYIQGTSYVASPTDIDIDTKFQGMKGILSGESLFFLAASGTGPVVINAFGGIDHIDLDGTLIVDTGHLVAFTEGIEYKIRKAQKGFIASFLSGEGLVLEMKGKGRVYLQSRNPNEYGATLGAKLPPRKE